MSPAFLSIHPFNVSLIAVVACNAFVDPGGAQETADVVMVRRPQNRREVRYVGRVMDYAAGTLRLRMKTSGSVRSLASADIVRIETPRLDEHVTADKQQAAGRLDEAAASFTAALALEQRKWVQREILASLTRLQLRRGDRLAAARAFIELTNSDPKTHHRSLVPLYWSNKRLDPSVVNQAKGWNTSANYFARLIAASMLFSVPSERTRAMKSMDEIAGSGRGMSDLARTQLWRGRLADAKPINNTEIKLWRGRVALMKQPERGGPWFLIGKAHDQRLEHEAAAIAFLWLPLAYQLDRELAAEASFEAAVSLQKHGNLPDATNMYRETAERFAGTIFARRANDVLRPQGK